MSSSLSKDGPGSQVARYATIVPRAGMGFACPSFDRLDDMNETDELHDTDALHEAHETHDTDDPLKLMTRLRLLTRARVRC